MPRQDDPSHSLNSIAGNNAPRLAARWWSEWQFWLLAIVCVAIYFSRMTDLPIRGEETRRAMVAWEILESGDWIVPRQQGEPFLSRPPVGSWPIAWLAQWTGRLTIVETRLPTLLATLFTTLLVYAYSRQFLSIIGALSSGLSYATFAQVLQLGRVAETEAIFALFLSGGFFVWHWGYLRKWPSSLVWSLAYSLIAIAALTKSLQAPVYFVGAVGLYLFVQRDLRSLFCRSHVAGLAAFALLLAAWQYPFYSRMNWEAVEQVWASDVGLRFAEISPQIVLLHFATFPIQVWACLLPWAFLLPAYAWPEFRRTIGTAKPIVVFAVCAWAIALPTCWFVPNARPRYLMPLYPLAAPLMGLVVQRVHESGAVAIVRRGWNWFVGGAAVAILVAAVAVAIASFSEVPALEQISQTRPFAAFYAIASAMSVALLVHTWNRWQPKQALAAVLAIALFAGLSFSGVAVNSLIARNADTAQQIAELRRRLPANEPLGSFGLVETIFSYHWRRPIEFVCRELPLTANELPSRFEYFCYSANRRDQIELPFPWRIEAVINCDRTKDSGEGKIVVVGRRLSTIARLSNEASKVK